jgi:hypothetical protein
VEDSGVRVERSSSRFTVWVPGGMYSPWITTMSSGHDVSEYEFRVYHVRMFHQRRGKID